MDEIRVPSKRTLHWGWKQLEPETKEFQKNIFEMCKNSELSYEELNKALCLTDKMLYTKCLTS